MVRRKTSVADHGKDLRAFFDYGHLARSWRGEVLLAELAGHHKKHGGTVAQIHDHGRGHCDLLASVVPAKNIVGDDPESVAPGILKGIVADRGFGHNHVGVLTQFHVAVLFEHEVVGGLNPSGPKGGNGNSDNYHCAKYY